jgi:hypothetical protein
LIAVSNGRFWRKADLRQMADRGSSATVEGRVLPPSVLE